MNFAIFIAIRQKVVNYEYIIQNLDFVGIIFQMIVILQKYTQSLKESMKKVNMMPTKLKQIINFTANMLFAFLVLAIVFGIIWFAYLIVEIQNYG